MSRMHKPVYALVDCNNFYASCEKLFRPDLRHTPVVVLSNLSGLDQVVSFEYFGRQVRATIQHNIGVPVCVGIAPTRTLVNHAAKKYPATGGVVDLTDPARQRRLMAQVVVESVWGVG